MKRENFCRDKPYTVLHLNQKNKFISSRLEQTVHESLCGDTTGLSESGGRRGRSVNPFPTRWGRLCPSHHYSPPPPFSDLPPSLIVFTQVHSVRFLDLKLRLLLQLILNLVFHKRAKILQSPIANSCEPKIAGDKYRKYVMNRTFLKKIYQVPTRTHEVSDLIVCPICRENLLTSYFFFKETRKIKSS